MKPHTDDTHSSQPQTSCHQLQSPTSSHQPPATNLQQRQNGCTLHMFGVSWRSIINCRVAKLVFIKICLMQWHSSGLIAQVSQQAPSCRRLLKPYSDLPLPPKSSVDKRRMIVVEHVEICSCGICNCSCWICIEQVVAFAFLVVEFSFVGLAVDGLASKKLWDTPLPSKSLVESKKNDSCGTCRDQNLLLSFIIQVFGW